MRWTNKHNLPDALCRAIAGADEDYQRIGDLSVSELSLPPRMLWLKRRHEDEIEEDYAQAIWKLLGKSVHYMIHKAGSPNSLQEEPLIYSIMSESAGRIIKLKGQPDLWEDGGLDDFKVTSTWSVINDLKIEWEEQLNFYAVCYRAYGFEVNRLRIIAVLRDWQIGRAKQGGDYPSVPAVPVAVPLWDALEAVGRLVERTLAQMQVLTQDTLPPVCEPEKRWHRPDTWAVMKEGRKSALRVLPSEVAAWNWAEDAQGEGLYPKAKLTFQHRPGRDVRCEDYCPVWSWCDHGQQVHESAAAPTGQASMV
jgi:hypothetical protein